VPIVLAVVCAVVYGVADYCGGRATRSAPSVTVTLVGQIASLVFGVVVVLIARDALAGPADLLWGCAAGIASAVALTSFYHALSHGAMTVVAPITAVSSAVLPIAFALIRGERPASLAYVGMIVAVFAVVLVSGAMAQHERKTSASILGLALVAGTGFAAIFVALEQTSDTSGYWPLLSSRATSIMLMVVFLGLGVKRRAGLARMAASVAALAAVGGILDMAANVLYLLAVRRGLLSIVVVVVSLYPVSTVVLAFGLDHERVARSQAVGMILAVSALVLVSLAGAQ
jgi:drug/metabolite transporter (DMT)-like permease